MIIYLSTASVVKSFTFKVIPFPDGGGIPDTPWN